MRLWLAAILLCAASGSALAQGSMQQLGQATKGHLYMSAGNMFAMDAGGPSAANTTTDNSILPGTLPSGVAFVNGAQALALYSGYDTGSAFSEFKIGFDGSGNALMTVDSVGGTPPTFTVRLNGVDFPFPGVGTGDVVGPATAAAGNLPSFSGTTGKLLQDSGVAAGALVSTANTGIGSISTGRLIHQQGGCYTFGRLRPADVPSSYCNNVVSGDRVVLTTDDPSLLTQLTITGVPVAGEQVGLNWGLTQLGLSATVRYTIQSGDTTSLVAAGIAACMGPSPGVNCTIGGTGGFSNLTTALLGLTPPMQLQANSGNVGVVAAAAGNTVQFDVGYGITACPTAVSSASTTVTLSGCTTLDVGPQLTLARQPTGRTDVNGDQLADVTFETSSHKYAQISVRVGTYDATNPVGKMLFGVPNSVSGGANTTMISLVGRRMGLGIEAPATAELEVNSSNFAGGAIADSIVAYLNSTIASTDTTAQYGIFNKPKFAPAGASLATAYGIFNVPELEAGSVNVATFRGTYSQVRTAAGYTGTVTTGAAQYVDTPLLAGSNPITNAIGTQYAAIANGNGITSGTVNNYGIFLNGTGAAAAGGGTVVNRQIIIGVPDANTAGSTNMGLEIVGNGGASATANWAIHSTSTAPSLLTGVLQIHPIAVASLPTCNAGAEGTIQPVVDANSATFAAAVTPAGTSHVIAYCNGSAWVTH